MKCKKILALMLVFGLLLTIIPFGCFTVSAEEFEEGYYTYTVLNGEAIITGCDSSISGDIIIPSTLGGYPVTSIGVWAFGYCNSITNIIIPNNVSEIGNSAFRRCTNLTNITIPDSVTSIDYYAFSDCENLKSIKISNNITEIAGYTFRNCANLTNITIPDSVTSIGYYAFYGCTNLANITIPDDVISIGESAFEDTAYYNNSSNWENDVLYIGKHLIKAKETISNSYNIKSGTRTIAYYAFYCCEELESVTIPNSVISIGRYAFCKCGFTNLIIPDSVTNIGMQAFYGCKNLTSVVISKNLTYIDYEVFAYCENLVNLIIPKSITNIDSNAFGYCSKITDVYYSGTEEEWNDISTRSEYLTDAEIHFNTSVEMLDCSVFGCIGGIATCEKRAICKYCKKEYGELGHIFDGGTVTKETSCLEEGITEYKCTLCKEVIKTETIAKLTHVYDNLVDGDCNLCGNTRIIQYISEDVETDALFDSDGKIANIVFVPQQNGKYEFSVVGENLTSISLYSIGADSAGSMIYGTKSYLSITHSLKSGIPYILRFGYKGENTGSYKVKVFKHIHIYENECDDVCNDYDCKERREAPHKYDKDCDTTCNLCNNTRTTSHKYSQATCTKPKTCKVCGATSGKALGHKYTTTTTKATISKNGKIVKKCSVCGDIASNKTVYYPKTIKLSSTSYTYTGSAKKPTVTVKGYDGKTISSSNYTVKYTNNIKAGTATVTVTFKGNYSGTKKLTFKINKASTTKATYKLSTTSYTYNGKAKTPTVTVKLSGKTLKKNTDYTVKYSNNKNVGKASIVITFKGNYKGTKTLIFKINPAGTTVKSLTAGKKSLKVAITKKTTQVTGYQIQYATNKSFKSAKTKYVTSYKTTSVTLKGLSAKKTYYVRVRTYKTVKGVKYYSGWSTMKYKKTK